MLSWLRRDAAGNFVVCVTNLTPVLRRGYRLGVPEEGRYGVLLDTDAARYGGSGSGTDAAQTSDNPCHGRPCSLELTLPPLATLILEKA